MFNFNFIILRLELLSHSEVNDLDAALLINHKIAHLQISVDNKVAVKVAHSLHDLLHIESCQVLADFATVIHLYKLFEHGALDEAHDDIVSFTAFEDVVGGAQ